MHYLYRITNLVNGKLYIGQSVDPETRWRQHQSESRKDTPGQVVSRALKKHGISRFTFEVIATCLTLDDANDLETYVIAQEQSHISTGRGYNVSNGGSNAPKTEAWKQQMSEWMTQAYADGTMISPWERMPPEQSDVEKQKRREQMTGNTYRLGTFQSDEWKQNHSEHMKQHPNDGQWSATRPPPVRVAAPPKPLKGPRVDYHHTPETREKIGAAQRGRRTPIKFSPELIQRVIDDPISNREAGIKYGMSKSNVGYYRSKYKAS